MFFSKFGNNNVEIGTGTVSTCPKPDAGQNLKIFNCLYIFNYRLTVSCSIKHVWLMPTVVFRAVSEQRSPNTNKRSPRTGTEHEQAFRQPEHMFRQPEHTVSQYSKVFIIQCQKTRNRFCRQSSPRESSGRTDYTILRHFPVRVFLVISNIWKLTKYNTMSTN